MQSPKDSFLQKQVVPKRPVLVKEHRIVSLLGLLEYIVAVFTFYASSRALIWVSPFLRDRSKLISPGDAFFRSGGHALFLMGLAFFMLGGLDLIKQFINQMHKYYHSRNKKLDRLAVIFQHLLFFVGCLSLTIACLRESDLLRKAIGESALFPWLDVDCTTNRQTSVSYVTFSILLFFAYILIKEVNDRSTNLENNRKNKREVKTYNSSRYRMFCSMCALLGFASLSVNVGLYLNNQDFYDPRIDHWMMGLLCFSLLMFFVYNVLNTPRIVHNHNLMKSNGRIFRWFLPFLLCCEFTLIISDYSSLQSSFRVLFIIGIISTIFFGIVFLSKYYSTDYEKEALIDENFAVAPAFSIK